MHCVHTLMRHTLLLNMELAMGVVLLKCAACFLVEIDRHAVEHAPNTHALQCVGDVGGALP